MAGFALLRIGSRFSSLLAGRRYDRAAIGFNPAHFVSAPEEHEKQQGQPDSPTEAIDRATALAVIPGHEKESGNQAVDNGDKKYNDQDFDDHDDLE